MQLDEMTNVIQKEGVCIGQIQCDRNELQCM